MRGCKGRAFGTWKRDKHWNTHIDHITLACGKRCAMTGTHVGIGEDPQVGGRQVKVGSIAPQAKENVCMADILLVGCSHRREKRREEGTKRDFIPGSTDDQRCRQRATFAEMHDMVAVVTKLDAFGSTIDKAA